MRRNILKYIFVCLFLMLCSNSAHAAECAHTYADDVCSECGTVTTAYLELDSDKQVDWVLQQDLYLDLYSFDISGTIKTNGYDIYLMDTSTWYYTCDEMGYFDCFDEDGSKIVPVKYFSTAAEMTGFNHRYMTIPTQNGYTAHRFYLSVTHTSLKPNSTGLGFKALFCGDDMVQSYLDTEKAFGYTLRLGDYSSVRYYLEADQFASDETVSLGVQNWDAEMHGETPLFVAVQIQLADGTVIFTQEHSITLRQQLERINDTYTNYTDTQLNAVRSMIEQNPVMLSWNISNIYTPDYAPVDQPAVETAYKFGVTLPSVIETSYYFSGELSSYYMATDTEVDAVPDVYLEQVSGGYTLYFLNNDIKTYINISYRSSSSSSVCVKLVTSGTPTVYQLNTQYKYVYTTLGSRSYYLGTYTSSSGTTYTTLSASNTSYISDVSTIGVTQFPAWFYGPDFGGNEDSGDEPEQVPDGEPCGNHTDTDNNGRCDQCFHDVTVVIDLFAINDLHGKLVDAESHPGVDELSTYLNNAKAQRDNVIILSSGDMWQGAAESNLTKGLIMTDWMNEMGFVSMTMGNHEYDWGEEAIIKNEALAEFPFLAINIYDSETNSQVDYCQSSVVVELDGIEIGVIGAIGDCYSSISSDMSAGVYFITGAQLTNLVKEEATRLRNEGVDFIVYSVHDGYAVDSVLSNGYVDIIFEGHTHQSYVKTDAYGIYHLQGGGDNEGICYASVTYNIANNISQVTSTQVIKTSTYSSLPDDPVVAELLEKYEEQVSLANKVLGVIPSTMYSTTILPTIAELYCQAGVEKWGDQYDIVLGGGYLNCRSPYDLEPGEVTYGMLMSILPFDNRLVLCSISGSNLLSKFINTSNSSYYVAYSDYGAQIAGSIVSNKTYYIIVDTYTAYYAPNNLTIIDFYDEGVFARDLFAAYIEENY